MKTCKTCAFRDEYGCCESEKLAESCGQPEHETTDMLLYSYSEGGGFWVGENFGCVHHQEKIASEDRVMRPVFLNDWKESGLNGLINDFEITDADVSGVNILLASYTYEAYSGTAFVLFEQGGKLYEVNGVHCSCYGLEGQWEPEETTLKALMDRVNNGRLGRDEFVNELTAIIEEKVASEEGKQ